MIEDILQAHQRIKPFIVHTPLISCTYLNELLGHEIIFKAESLQITGAFKVRGVLNTVLSLKEQGNLPEKLVAYSSGNHAKAVAWVGAEVVHIPTEVYMHKSASFSKQRAVKALGANLIITDTRIAAETGARNEGKVAGNYFLHPSDNELVINGAATLMHEALSDLKDDVPDAIFAACGGGALLSGTYLGARSFGYKNKIFGAEPSIANDASTSYKLGKITGFDESPQTIADGLRTLKVSPRTFDFLQKLDGFIEASEEDILHWSMWLYDLLPVPCEPTAAVAMASAFNWLKTQKNKQKVLIILSGGNIDNEMAVLFDNNKNHPNIEDFINKSL